MPDATAHPAPLAPPTRRGPLLAAAAVAVVGVAIVAGATLAGRHGSGASGSLDDATLVGTTARPALQSQGLTVRVSLPGGSVLATVTGPETPGQGLPYQQQIDTTTWTVRLDDATTAVPVSLADFDTLDHRGMVGHPVAVPDTPAPPALLAPGRSVTFEVRETMAVGEGLLRYAPDGHHLEASWDFEVEND